MQHGVAAAWLGSWRVAAGSAAVWRRRKRYNGAESGGQKHLASGYIFVRRPRHPAKKSFGWQKTEAWRTICGENRLAKMMTLWRKKLKKLVARLKLALPP